MARLGGQGLAGNTPFESAQIDQFIDFSNSSISAHARTIAYAIFGWAPVETETYNTAVKDLKAVIISLNAHLQGKSYLVGERLTVADIVTVVSLLLPFQTALDGGFRKSVAPNVAAWLERVLSVPEVVRRLGHVKLAQKVLKPVAPPKKEEVKAAAKPQAAKTAGAEGAEEEDAKPKKVVDPLDALPPSKLDFMAWKTYFVNLPDKKGEGMTNFWENYDPEGYCLYYAKYDKAEGEGTVTYQFANLLNGFLQRLDDFRRHCFGAVIMTGEEPNLDIESVWMFRGTTIPARMDEHPQWEYFTTRRLDHTNAADRELIGDFWSVKTDGVVQGKKAQIVKAHK